MSNKRTVARIHAEVFILSMPPDKTIDLIQVVDDIDVDELRSLSFESLCGAVRDAAKGCGREVVKTTDRWGVVTETLQAQTRPIRRKTTSHRLTSSSK